MFITVANQKGGVGKTTLTTLLALELRKHTKQKVTVVDTDPQLSLYTNLIDLNKDDGIKIVKEALKIFTDNAEKYSNYPIVLIDTLPATDLNILELLKISDLVLVPTGANLLDIGATLNTIKVLNMIDKPYKLIFNNVKNINDFKEIKKYLLKEDVSVAENYLMSRVAYSRLFKNNLMIEDHKANHELNQLITELL